MKTSVDGETWDVVDFSCVSPSCSPADQAIDCQPSMLTIPKVVIFSVFPFLLLLSLLLNGGSTIVLLLKYLVQKVEKTERGRLGNGKMEPALLCSLPVGVTAPSAQVLR